MSDRLTRQIAADDEAVEAIRAKFGDAEAARLAADLYKLRRAPAGGTWAGVPRWVVILAALWLGALETADKLPELLLSYPRYQAALAEAKAKLLQPEVAAAELEKARYEAKAAAFQPDMASTGLDKARSEAKAATFQPALTAGQAFKADLDAEAGGMSVSDPRSATRLGHMFDLLDPNHPGLVSAGVIDPDVTPMIIEGIVKKTIHLPEKKDNSIDQSNPASLRKPILFDCSKAYLGVDYVICDSPKLLDAEARLEDAYKAARAAKGDTVKDDQVAWSNRYGPDCGLPARGKPTPEQIASTTPCVSAAMEKRIGELQAQQ